MQGRSFGVKLDVTSTTGCKDSFMQCKYITIAHPKADFPVNNIGCFGKINGISIPSKATPPPGKALQYTCNWEIRSESRPLDTALASGTTGIFTCDALGVYDVYLKVSNGHCYGDTFKKAALTVIGDSTGITASPRAGCMSPHFTTTISVAKQYYYPVDPNNPPLYHWTVPLEDNANVSFEDPFAKTTKVTILHPGCYTFILDVFTILGNDTCKDEYIEPNLICAGVTVFYEVDDRKCPGDTINVTNVSDKAAFNFKWNITPASLAQILPNDTAKNIKIVFNAADTCYFLQLIASKIVNGNVCTDTLLQQVCMPPLRTNFFTTTPSLYCAPTIGRFYDPVHHGDSSQFPIKYLWDFGDGDTLATNNDSVAHVYTTLQKGNYDVKLTVSYKDGCSYTIVKPAIDVVGPVPHFSMDSKIGCDSTTVQFNNTSKNVSSFYFFYGDGTPVLTTNPGIHKYVLQDPRIDSVTYYPTLIETDDTVCKVFYKDTVKVYRIPVDAQIKTDNTYGCVPLTVHFHAVSRAGNSWRWDFDGDGKIDDSTHKDSVFTYKTPGKYTPTLTISFQGHCAFTINSSPIEVTPVSGAGFVPSSFNFCGNQSVSFKNTTKNAAKYIFDYGDGTLPDTDLISNHKYLFNAPNDSIDSIQFIPKIIAINGAGCSDTFKTVLTEYKAPVAGFKSSLVSGCSPLKVHFSDTSLYSSIAEWDFDNDGKIDAKGKEVDWVYSPGLYTVKLRSISKHGCVDSVVKVNLIEVNEPPKAGFSVSDSTVCYRNSVHFTDLSFPTENLVNWHWNFGDSLAPFQSSNQKNPSFRYYSPGWHTVTLTVTDDKGCTSTTSKRAVFVDDTIPPPNITLLFVSVIDTNSLLITWKKSHYPLFKSYRINRLENGKPVQIFSTTDVKDTVFIDHSPKINTSGLSYCYTIQTKNICDSFSVNSNQHCSILLSETAQADPSNVLTWTAYVGWQPIAYQIYRAGDNGITQLINTVNGKTLTYTDSSLCDETYCYYVEAVSDSGYISKSNITCLHADYVRIVNPFYLKYVTVWNDKQTKLEWDGTNNKNFSAYLIDRYSQSTGWVNKYAASLSNYFIDNNVDVYNTSYIYRVHAIDKCGYINPLSNDGTSILLNQKISNDNVALSWNNYRYWPNSVKNYKLQIQLKDRSFKTIAVLKDSVYTDDSVYHAIDTAYCYRVIAYQNAPGTDSSVSNRTCAVLPSRIFVPNAFTPGNKDSLNDVWKISAISVYNTIGKNIKSFSTRIFNRWGTLIFETNDLNKGWDGTFRGQAVPLDVYIYLIDAEGIDGRNIHLKGNITIVN